VLLAKSVTLKDIARKAEVSVATVSLVLNNKASVGTVRISQETVDRVRLVAEKLDYFPNLSARAMSGGKTSLIGLILSEIKYSSEQLPLIHGITDVLDESGFSLAMGRVTHNSPDIEMEEIRIANRKGFDGLMLEGTGAFLSRSEQMKEAFRNWENVVLINRPVSGGFTTVAVDQELAGYFATQHLLGLGHRTVAFAGRHPDIEDRDDPQAPRNMVARYRGYIRAIEAAGVERIVVAKGADLLDSSNRATGVYCALSYDGPDLLCECIDRGMRVPDDLSIVGQDDAREKQIVRPALTTVNMRSEEMGKTAARAVISKIEGKDADDVMLEPELIVRDSTGEPDS
jgi:LacI family transcriptional regulator